MHYPLGFRPSAIIFDLDGTLVDSLPDIAASMNATLLDLGHRPHSTKFYLPLIGSGVETMVVGALPVTHTNSSYVEEACKLMRKHYRRLAFCTTKPYPGILTLLAEIVRVRIPISILSNKLHEETMIIVRKIFPAVPFSLVLGQKLNTLPKPDHAGILTIARSLNCHPREMIMIGDGEPDIAVARRSGAFPIGVTWGYRSAQSLITAGASDLITSPSDLLRYIKT